MEARKTPRQIYIDALLRGDVTVVAECLAKGMSPNLRIDKDLTTPGHIAVQLDNLALFVLLGEYQANFTLANGAGRSAIDLAIDKKSSECYLYLQEQLKQKGMQLQPSSTQANPQATLPSSPPPQPSGQQTSPPPQPSVTSSQPQPALTVRQKMINAVLVNDISTLDRLLNDGASPTFFVDKEPVMHYAIKHQNKPLIDLLVGHGAKVDIKHNGKTSLDLARGTPLEEFVKSKQGKVPDLVADLFLDPILPEEFTDPVITPQGTTYNRSTMVQMGYVDPFTKAKLNEADVIPNLLVLTLLKYYKSCSDSKQIPPCLITPHTRQVFKVPVVTVDGVTWEESSLQGHLRAHSNMLSSGKVQDRYAYPNSLITNLISAMGYDQQQKQEAAPVPAPVPVQAQPVEESKKRKFEEIEEKKVEQPVSPPVAPPVVVVPVKPAPLVPLSVFSQPPVPPKAAASPQDTQMRAKILEKLEDTLSLDTFEDPIIHFNGITYSKLSVLTITKDPADPTQEFHMEDTVPNLLIAQFIEYINLPSTDFSKIPPCLICSETNAVFKDPVVADDGKTYEQAWLDRYLRGHRNTLPGSQIKQSRLPFKNMVLEQVIELFTPMLAPAPDHPSQESKPSDSPKPS